MGKDSRELVETLRRLGRRAGRNGGKATPVDTGPGSTFEALLGQRLSSLEERVEEVRGRVNGLFFLVLSTVAVQALLRVAGF
jgi:hypothetical protein